MKIHLQLLVVFFVARVCFAGDGGGDSSISRAQARERQREKAQVLLKDLTPSNATNHLAQLDEAERICDSLLWASDAVFPTAIVLKARVLLLRGKTREAQELLKDHQAVISTLTREALARGVPKEKTPEFEADRLKADMARPETANEPLGANGNK
jgi:hypothetical protein